MKFDVPRIVKKLALKEYAEEFGETVMYVWVNPPRKIILDVNKGGPDGVIKLMSELWSQGPEGTHVSPDEVVELVEGTIETDPDLFRWLRDKTFSMIGEHRNAQKKA